MPTLNETGAFQLEMETWFGWFAPAKTPSAVVERLRAARTARDYEVAWTRSRASRRVLEELERHRGG